MENSVQNSWGASLLASANSFAKLENGTAVFSTVEPHLSQSGNNGLRLTFSHPKYSDDSSKRHYEYVSASQADRLNRTMERLRYMFVYADNAEANVAFSQIPYPFADVVDDNGEIVYANSEEELKSIKANNADIEFLNISTSKWKAVRWNVDKEQIIASIKNALNCLVDTRYELKFEDNEKGFPKLVRISKFKQS